MHNNLPAVHLTDYQPPYVLIRCERCSRLAEANVAAAKKRHGNITMGELARRVAAGGGKAGVCALAMNINDNRCAVRPEEPPVHHWAYLDQARRGGWTGLLRCERHMAAMKSAKPCPEVLVLDLNCLVSVLRWDFPLEHLPSKLNCHMCGCELVSIEWIVPAEPPQPGGSSKQPMVRRTPRRLVKNDLRVLKAS